MLTIFSEVNSLWLSVSRHSNCINNTFSTYNSANVIRRNLINHTSTLLLLAALLISGPAQAELEAQEPVILSGSLAPSGDVTHLQINVDGSRVVFLADANTNFVPELFSVAIGGGERRRLNSDGQIVRSDFKLTPDGQNVVYRARQGASLTVELYVVPILGGTPRKLNPDLVAGGNVAFPFYITSDGARVVYYADQTVDDAFGIFSIALDGSDPSRISLVGQSAEDDYILSPNDQRVVYQARPTEGGDISLYSGLVSGAGSNLLTNLSSRIIATDQTRLAITPDSQFVIFINDPFEDGVSELVRVPIGGGALFRLNDDLVFGGDVRQFRINSSSSRVVYIANQLTRGVNELFSVAISGGVVTKLNIELSSQGDVQQFLISPDDLKVVYRAGRISGGINELFSVQIAGGPSTRLNSDLTTFGQVSAGFKISGGSERVIYIADQDTAGVEELFSVPLGGGVPSKLNSNLASGGDVLSFFLDDDTPGVGVIISPDSRGVAYIADQDTDNIFELYLVSIDGGSSLRLNSDFPQNARINSMLFSPTGDHIVYVADQNVAGVDELFSVALSGLSSEPEPEPAQNNELCFPIKARNNAVALLCI